MQTAGICQYAKHHIFLYPGLQDIMIRVGFSMHVTTPTYPVVPISTFCCTTVCDHNPPTLQRHGETYIMPVS